MENLLVYIWQYRLYPHLSYVTTEGQKVEIIDTGQLNTDAGPDFFNAKIRIDGTVWAGSVEMHTDAADWNRHHHTGNKAYDNVILHVTEYGLTPVYRTNGERIPQLILSVSRSIRENIASLLSSQAVFPCQDYLSKMDPFHFQMWLDVLLIERLERKTNDINKLLQRTHNDWNQAFYVILCRNFGFGLNSEAFERLARNLPLQFIHKQRSNPLQVEALFFGQAGYLEEEKKENAYYTLLRREYIFLRHKYNLTPMPSFVFKRLRTRPINFPHLKLAQLAAIWTKYDTLFSLVLSLNTIEEMKKVFVVKLSDYWLTHYSFEKTSEKRNKTIGDSALNLLVINTLVPMLFAYGRYVSRPEYEIKAMALLKQIPAENNFIIRAFRDVGIQVKDARDTQALIQLKRAYCERKKCMYCRVGFRLLKEAAMTL